MTMCEYPGTLVNTKIEVNDLFIIQKKKTDIVQTSVLPMFLTSHSAHHAPPFSAAWDPVHASPVSFPRTPRLRSDQGVWQILQNSNSKRDAFV